MLSAIVHTKAPQLPDRSNLNQKRLVTDKSHDVSFDGSAARHAIKI